MDLVSCNQITDKFRLLMALNEPFLPFVWSRSLRIRTDTGEFSLLSGKIHGQSPWNRLDLLQRSGGSLHFHEDTDLSLTGHGIFPVFQKYQGLLLFPGGHFISFRFFQFYLYHLPEYLISGNTTVTDAGKMVFIVITCHKRKHFIRSIKFLFQFF